MSCFQLSITCSLYHRNGQGRMGEGEEVGTRLASCNHYTCNIIANSTNRPCIRTLFPPSDVYRPTYPVPSLRCVQAHLPCPLPQMCTGPLTLSPPSDVYRPTYPVPSLRCLQAHLPCPLPQMCTGPLTLPPPSDVYRPTYPVPSLRCVQAHLPSRPPQMCTGPLTLSPPSDVYRCAYLVPSRLPRRATEAENVFSSPVTCDEGGRAVQCRGLSVAPTSCGTHSRPHLPSMPQHH